MDFSSQEEDERGGDYNKGHLSFGKRARGFLQRASSFGTQGHLCAREIGARASGGEVIPHFFVGGWIKTLAMERKLQEA